MADGLVSKFYATAVPKSVLARGIEATRDRRGAGSQPGGPASARWNRWTTSRSASRMTR